MRGDLVRKLTARCLTVGLAVLAFLLLALTTATWPGLLLSLAAVTAAVLERRVRPDAEVTAEFVLLLAGILVAYHRQLGGGADPALLATAPVALALLLLDAPLRRARSFELRAVNLELPTRNPFVTSRFGHAVAVLLTGIALCALVPLAAWWALLLTLLIAAAVGLSGLDLVLRRLRPSATPDPVVAALKRHQPEFVLYFSAPAGSEYQATMWLPYLERIGRPFMVLVREADHLAALAAATTAPVVHSPTVRAVDQAIVPSLRVAFYVNHGAKNSHCLRFSRLTHIQLHHGDSDKTPSANPLTAIFDKVFVAGEAAVERYARNGVHIPREKFVVVGRPQVESITVVPAHRRPGRVTTVLYTPTWTGHNADADYCSLPIAEELLRRLLAREITVILRPHPYTLQNPQSARQLARLEELLAADRDRSGRQHAWGATATRTWSLAECVNRSDALISDVSGVVSDYLYSGKPFAVTNMSAPPEDFTQEFPLSRAGYVLHRDLATLDRVLDDLLVTDPLAELRWSTRSRYLGDFPAESYADVFVSQARRFVTWQAPAPRAGSANGEPGQQPHEIAR
ncbi:CDP-glycerol glycerophosphotransferase family protein [Melissospora conviva]|uniref:CDP-glycerol glycerophosphotransferase family protein n=1 Tax=Melissospora conviva TaxID=3388432 RepID=UPI003C1B7A9B